MVNPGEMVDPTSHGVDMRQGATVAIGTLDCCGRLCNNNNNCAFRYFRCATERNGQKKRRRGTKR